MNIPTANVVVSFDRDVMNRLFAEGATYDSLVQGLTVGDDEALLFNAEGNANLISFEHTANYGDSVVMKLDFIDPRGQFEERFISAKVLDNIVGYDYKKNSKTLDGIAKLDLNGQKMSTEGFSKQFYSELTDAISNKYSEREIFVAYGSGRNLDLWSGPHRMFVTGATLDVKGPRKISLRLSPTPNELNINNRRGSIGEKINLNFRGMTVRCSGRSRQVKFDKLLDAGDGFGIYDPLYYLKDKFLASELIDIGEIKNQNLQILDSLGLEDLRSTLLDFDIHYLVVDAIRHYIQNATGNQNVVVLLPNLNLLCRKIINETAKNAKIDWFTPDPQEQQRLEQVAEALFEFQAQLPDTEDETLPELDLGQSTTSYRPSNPYAEAPKKTFDLFSTLGGTKTDFSKKENVTGTVTGSIQASRVNTQLLEADNSRKYTAKKEFIKKILAKFGLLLEEISQRNIEAPPSEPDLPIPMAYIGINAANERYKTPAEAFEGRLRDNKYYAVIQESTSKGMPDHTRVLADVFDSIRDNARGEYTFDIGYLVETNTKILDVWTKDTALNCSRFPLFAGYYDLDPTQETIIVGDKALIREYLYGKIDLDKKNKSIDKIKSEASTASKEMTNVDFVDDMLVIDPIRSQLVDKKDAANIRALGDLQALKSIPLHPLDKAILTNSDYNKVVFEAAHPPVLENVINLTGAFGGVTDLPDDFGYSENFSMTEFEELNKGNIDKAPVSVFKYNTSNPNVLDLTFNWAPQYLAALKSVGFKKVVKDVASAVAGGVLPLDIGSFPIRTEQDAIAFMKMQNYTNNLGDDEKEVLVERLAASISPELSKQMNLSTKKHSQIIASLLDALEQHGDFKSNIEIDQLLPGDPFTAMSELVKTLYERCVQVNMKTLPSFHLSKLSNLSDMCLLFAQDAPITQSQKADRSAINAFYSGLYKVVGFKHKIDSNGAQSEFKLTKHIPKENEV